MWLDKVLTWNNFNTSPDILQEDVRWGSPRQLKMQAMKGRSESDSPACLDVCQHAPLHLFNLSPLNGSPDGSLIVSGTWGFSLIVSGTGGFFRSTASRSTKTPCCSSRRRTCEEMGHEGTSAHFLSFRASACSFFHCQGTPCLPLLPSGEMLGTCSFHQLPRELQVLNTSPRWLMDINRAEGTLHLTAGFRGSGLGRASGKSHDKLKDTCTSVKETKIKFFSKNYTCNWGSRDVEALRSL